MSELTLKQKKATKEKAQNNTKKEIVDETGNTYDILLKSIPTESMLRNGR